MNRFFEKVLRFLLLLVLGILTVAACKVKKTSAGSSAPFSGELTERNLLQRTDSSALKYSSLAFKGTVTYEDNGEKNKFNYRIIVLKDSLIWVSAGLFGIEGGRILITRDSVRYMNRLEKNYLVSDFAPVKEVTGGEVNVGQLQSLLVGDLPRQSRNSKICFKGDKAELIREYSAGAYSTFWVEKKTLKLTEVLTAFVSGPEKKQNKSRLIHSDFREVSGQMMPFLTTVTVESADKKTALTFQHSDIEINPANPKTPFNIPSDYEPIQK